MGVPYLQRVLNSVLTSHIQRTLPELMTRLQNKRAAAMTELESLQQEEHTETLLSRCVHVRTSRCPRSTGEVCCVDVATTKTLCDIRTLPVASM